jgi:hypothetical protein
MSLFTVDEGLLQQRSASTKVCLALFSLLGKLQALAGQGKHLRQNVS